MSVPLPHPNITPPPGAQLDSAALGAIFDEIQRNLDALSLALGEGNKREVRGAVSSTGSIEDGTGFTVAHPGTGIYVITLGRELAVPGIIVATPRIGFAGPLLLVSGPSKSAFEVVARKTLEAVENTAFNFTIKAP